MRFAADRASGWIRVHGWVDWSATGNTQAVPMLFQARHICGAYPSKQWPQGVTSLLFVNCEVFIQETVEEVRHLLGLVDDEQPSKR